MNAKSKALGKKKGIFRVGSNPSMFIHKDGKNEDLHEHWRDNKQTILQAKKVPVKDAYGGNIRWHLFKTTKRGKGHFKGVSHGTHD